MDLDKYREFKVNMIGESGDVSEFVISAYGTSYNCSDTGTGNISLSFAGNITTFNTLGRGITLLIVEHSTKNVLLHQRFDTYGNDADKTELANTLNDIHGGGFGDVIYAMASFDAIGVNTNLGIAMDTARAYQWYQLPGYSNGPTHRHPYAVIGTSRLGIIKEVLHSNATGAEPSTVSAHIPTDWNAIGSEGYGPDLLTGSRIGEFSYTGTGYSFAHGPHLTVPTSGAYSIKEDEYVRMTGQQKISLDRKEDGGYVRSYFWTASDSDGWIRSSSHSGYSTEWESFELYFRWDQAQDTASSSNSGGALARYLRMGHYHYPNSKDVGTSYVRNIQVQKCGFSPGRDRDITLKGVDEIDGRNIVESAGPFSLLRPDTYWTVFHSDRNLTGRPNLGDSRYGNGPFDTNTVKWFDRELTDRSHYSIHEGKDYSGDSNRYNDIGRVAVDPNKMYVGLIWQYCHEKSNGYNYFGTHTYNSSGGTTSTLRYDGASSTTNPYSMYPAASSIEKNQWTLWSYWFLPSWFTDAEGTDFYNNYWCNWAGNYENASADNNQKTAGSRFNNGGNIRVARLKGEDTQIHLRWLDFYNSGNTPHKTWWALPMIIEVDPLNLGARGDIDPWNLTEDSTYAASRAGLPKGIA